MIKLETDTKKILISKLVYIIVTWFLNWYIISHQGFCYQLFKFDSKNLGC